jgi:hypothetical protein
MFFKKWKKNKLTLVYKLKGKNINHHSTMAADRTLFFAVALLSLLFFNTGRKIESV